MSYVASIQDARFRLKVENGNLVIEPFSKLTHRQLEFLRRHKAEIIAELTSQAADEGGDTLDTALQQACRGLRVTPEQVRDAMCDADVAEWRARRIRLAELEAFAKALDRRLHGKLDPVPEVTDPLLVPTWTPAGGCILVKARNDEHAAWLKRVNPPPATAKPEPPIENVQN